MEHTKYVKRQAHTLGFDYCGVARAQKLDEDATRLERWLHNNMHGSMQYMEKYFDLRVDPTKLVPGAKSVITLMKNYFPSTGQPEGNPRISKYAYGRDYHEIIREKLNHLLLLIREHIGEVHGRGFVDSAPVLERSWASRSGLGWIGKNGNLISKQSGSFFFIATLVTDLDLDPDDPFAKDYCGTCTKCIDECPTQAILPDKVIDASKCISYYTIELKEMLIPEDARGKFDNWMFGCDTCQDVCPWNRFSKPHTDADLAPLPGLLDLSTNEWEEMTEEQFKTFFRDSPIRRAKFEGIRRNLKFLKDRSPE